MDPIRTEERPVFRFEKKDWLRLLLALGVSLLWFAVFTAENIGCLLFNDPGAPALGTTLTTWAVWLSVLLSLGKRARWTAWNRGLAAVLLLLSLCCSIYGNVQLRTVNLLLIFFGSFLCFFSLSGAARAELTRPAILPEALGLFFRSLFSHCLKPFRALVQLGSGGRRLLLQILLGLAAAIPLLAMVIVMLSSADAVFSSLFTSLGDWLETANAGRICWKLIRILALTLLSFSALYFLAKPGSAEEESAELAQQPAEKPENAPFHTVLVLLNLVYAVFVAIQFTFLFGGAEAAAMKGGWAEYARSGFFQLVWVSLINLGACLLCTVLPRGGKTTKLLCSLLLAFTAVILFSAFWRMRLYIRAYGLSLLRAETLWAMAFIGGSLLLAALRIRKPGFRFWPAFAALGLCGWLVFNFLNVDARIAEYNVQVYLSGKAEEIDLRYLAKLSPDVIPALEKLESALQDSEPELAAQARVMIAAGRGRDLGDGWNDNMELYRYAKRQNLGGGSGGGWAQWNLSAARFREK